MNLLEFLLDLAWSLFHPPRPDHDRSIVGQSPVDRKVARFWKIAGTIALALLLLWVGWAWFMPDKP